jgi:hypothetical protein
MKNFNLQAFLTCANELVRADEVERALWLLDNLPGYYRDHKPPEVLALKREIMARICTPVTYAALDVDEPTAYHPGIKDTLRAQMLLKEVKWMNENWLEPHVIDLAPGAHWADGILREIGADYSYQAVSLKPSKTASVVTDEQPIIFLALELIEHLWNETDIRIESLKFGRLPDIIHISTPMYSFDTECMEWRERDLLGHLRTYTPGEFRAVLLKLFPEYSHLYYESKVQQARLTLNESVFESIRDRKATDILCQP